MSVIFGQHLISGVVKQERDWGLAYLVEAQTPKNPCENWKSQQRIVSAFVLLCHSTGMLWETGALSIWAVHQELSLKQSACLQQKPMLAWVQTVRTRHWENKPVAISLEMKLHFQAQKGRDWAAASHLLSVDFQLAVTKQSNIFSPCPSSSAAYVHCSPELVLAEFCNELYQGAYLTKNENSRGSCWFDLQLHQTHCATMGVLKPGLVREWGGAVS